MVGFLKSKIFGQKSIYSKEIIVFCALIPRRAIKKCPNPTFKVNFLFQKTKDFFFDFFKQKQSVKLALLGLIFVVVLSSEQSMILQSVPKEQIVLGAKCVSCSQNILIFFDDIGFWQ